MSATDPAGSTATAPTAGAAAVGAVGGQPSLFGQRGATVWFTGLSGAGKSTVAEAVRQRLAVTGRRAYLLDGDRLRAGLNADLGFDPASRCENVRRVAEVARLVADAGLIALVSVIAPYGADRARARTLHEQDGLAFREVWVSTALSECERRDPKGLYARARSGELAGMTGIDAPYEPPIAADLELSGRLSVHEGAERVLELIEPLTAPSAGATPGCIGMGMPEGGRSDLGPAVAHDRPVLTNGANTMVLRPPVEGDAGILQEMLGEPEVARWWGLWDISRVTREMVGSGQGWVIVLDDRVAGWVEASVETDPDYEHVGLDIILARQWRGQGHGPAALTLLMRHFRALGHHRFTIDPAVENVEAIRAYRSLGFAPVGVMRAYERGPDGRWRDGLLMDLLAEDLDGDPCIQSTSTVSPT